MATKKKKKAPARKAPARRKAAVKRAPAPAVHAAPAPVQHGSPNALLLVLVALGLLVLGWLFVRSRQPKPAATPMPGAAASTVGAPPEARRPSEASQAAAKPKPAAPAQRREAAGSLAQEPAEKGAPSLTYDRSSGEPLSVRCWRPEGGKAQLDIFAPRNRPVKTLASEAGKAGWVELAWDGKDAAGKKVPVGLYFLRPSQKDEQSIKDIWVKD